MGSKSFDPFTKVGSSAMSKQPDGHSNFFRAEADLQKVHMGRQSRHVVPPSVTGRTYGTADRETPAREERTPRRGSTSSAGLPHYLTTARARAERLSAAFGPRYPQNRNLTNQVLSSVLMTRTLTEGE